MLKLTKAHARKVVEVVDHGLCSGSGRPELGHMCVENAVCFALGLPFSDDPECVSAELRSFKIALNDQEWSSKEVRAKGMRKLAVLQLGTKGVLDGDEFLKRILVMVTKTFVPMALRSAAKVNKKYADSLESAASECEINGSKEAAAYAAKDAYAAAEAAEAANAAYAAAYAANAAAEAASAAYAAAYDAANAAYRDEYLNKLAEGVCDILIDMKVPAVKWLSVLD